MNVSYNGRTYMVGGIAYDEEIDEASPLIEWLVQIHKSRSLKEKLLGREKIDGNDPFVQLVFQSLDDEEAFIDVNWG